MERIWKILIVVVIVLAVSFTILLLNRFYTSPGFVGTTPCGYGGTSDAAVECSCDGRMTEDVKIGSTAYHCVGTCSGCRCYDVDLVTRERTEVDCSEFEHLEWAFTK